MFFWRMQFTDDILDIIVIFVANQYERCNEKRLEKGWYLTPLVHWNEKESKRKSENAKSPVDGVVKIGHYPTKNGQETFANGEVLKIGL